MRNLAAMHLSGEGCEKNEATARFLERGKRRTELTTERLGISSRWWKRLRPKLRNLNKDAVNLFAERV